MISEIDVKDWQMLSDPLKLKALKEGELFSVAGNNKIFKLILNNPKYCLAETEEISMSFILPNFMDVFKWQLKS